MRSFILISSLLLIFSVTSCTDQPENPVSPLAPEVSGNSTGTQEDCQANLLAIANAVILHFYATGSYPASIEELGAPYNELTCPQCGAQYLFESDVSNYMISCPAVSSVPHGSVQNGVPSWIPDAEGICRHNMLNITFENTVFYAINGRYAENLDELGMSDLTCPACAGEYVYLASNDEFYLKCYLPAALCHGYVNSGILSWNQSPEDLCRANMRTIASQDVLFYATNGRYAETLEELGMAGVVCPQCGDEYILKGDENSFYLECGLQSDPNHGKIDNGVASW